MSVHPRTEDIGKVSLWGQKNICLHERSYPACLLLAWEMPWQDQLSIIFPTGQAQITFITGWLTSANSGLNNHLLSSSLLSMAVCSWIWRDNQCFVLLPEINDTKLTWMPGSGNTHINLSVSLITHLEPDILECKVKWALGSITMNKGSRSDGIPGELFQILKDDAVRVLHSIWQQIWKTQQCPQDWKWSVFIPIPKKGNAKECSNYCTIVLISHTSKIMLKILQARLQQYMNHELPDVQDIFRKGRGTRDQIANIYWIIEKARQFQKNIYFCFIDYAKVWLYGSQQTLDNSYRDGNTRPPDLPPEKSVCRSRSNS